MAVFLFSMTGCYSAGPSEGDFLITVLEFSGDSTGNRHQEERNTGEPYCEFSLEWQRLDDHDGFIYTLYRSTEPFIQADPSKALEVCSTPGNSWLDSEGLLWDTTYYYAVEAEHTHGETKWSDEACAATPGSPFPQPSVLAFEKTGFTSCSLHWTGAGTSFRSYTVLRSSFPQVAQHLWFADTLLVSFDIDSLNFTDTWASPSGISYYVLALSDSSGLSSFSNEVEFTPGGEVPWIISYERAVYGLGERFFSITGDGARITGSRVFSSYSQAWVLDSANGLPLYSTDIDASSLFELSDGNLALSYSSASGSRFGIYTFDLSSETVARSFPPVNSVTELNGDLLLGCGSTSALVHGQTLETIESFSFGFEMYARAPDGVRLYLLNSSGVLVFNPEELMVEGGIPGNFSDVRVGPDGLIRCVNSQRVDIYDPADLALVSQFVFPQQAAESEVVLLPPDYIIAYVPVQLDDALIFRLWDTASGESPGTIVPEHGSYLDIQDVLASPGGDFLWGLCTGPDMQRTAFRISL